MRSVYIFIVDCLRYDGIGRATQEGTLTPQIDAFAHDAVSFENAVAQATWSRNAGAAIMTGLYPAAAGLVTTMLDARSNKYREYKSAAISSQVRQTLGTLFQRNGFQTFGYSANPFFSKRHGLARGFNTFPSMFSDPVLGRRAAAGLKLAERLERKMLPIITTRDLVDTMCRDEGDDDHLTVVWSMDAHPPLYDRQLADQVNEISDSEIVSTIVSARQDIGRAEALYEHCVRYFDHQFGEFVARLKRQGTYENSTIILTADHGESFGEHGLYGHTGFPYEEQIHIPLLIKFAGNEYAGRQVDELVGAIDILPTLADLYGLTLDEPVHGKSLLPILRGEAAGHEYLVVHDQTHNNDWEYYCIRFPTRKYILRQPLQEMSKNLSMHQLLSKEFSLLGQLLKARAIHKKRRIARKMLAPFRNALGRKQVVEIFDHRADVAEMSNLVNRAEGAGIIEAAEDALQEYLLRMETFLAHHGIEYTEADVDERMLVRLRKLGYMQ